MEPQTSSVPSQLPKATSAETLGVLSDIILPTLAKGVLKRRPMALAAAERMNLDQRAIKRMQKLRDRHGRGPVMLRVPFRNHVLILDPDDVGRVLDKTPEPFATATVEKQAALAHFQPGQALISHGPERTERRQFQEDVLENRKPCHHLTDRFALVVREEAAGLLARARMDKGQLDWDSFAEGWFRVVRRVVFGDAAREDRELTDMIDTLRSHGNWAFLHPKRKKLRQRFTDRVNHYLQLAESGSLAAVIAAMPKQPDTRPDQQVPQWLFAFDPAGMATFRTLALLSTHPEQAARAREEIDSNRDALTAELPFLRACVLESLRLWATTPLILRESTEETVWETGVLPARSNVAIFTPFFHRDPENLDFANRFDPDLWLTREPEAKPDWPIVPFSSGPGMCPGRHVVLLVTSTMLAELLKDHELNLEKPSRLAPSSPLPATLDNYSLRFEVSDR